MSTEFLRGLERAQWVKSHHGDYFVTGVKQVGFNNFSESLIDDGGLNHKKRSYWKVNALQCKPYAKYQVLIASNQEKQKQKIYSFLVCS